MKFIEKFSDNKFILKLNVKTNCKTQKVMVNDDFLTILLKSKPIQNKANKELLNLLKKRLNVSSSQIQMISGSKSSEKIIKLNFSENTEEQEIAGKLLG
ncbi:MAG: DUF167 family protein [Candidatus Thorarchaeota archaeon]